MCWNGLVKGTTFTGAQTGWCLSMDWYHMEWIGLPEDKYLWCQGPRRKWNESSICQYSVKTVKNDLAFHSVKFCILPRLKIGTIVVSSSSLFNSPLPFMTRCSKSTKLHPICWLFNCLFMSIVHYFWSHVISHSSFVRLAFWSFTWHCSQHPHPSFNQHGFWLDGFNIF